MAQRGQGRPDIAPAAVYLEGVAKNLLQRFYGADGPPWGTAELVQELSGLNLGPKQIERLLHKIGQERVDERDAEVRRFEELPLAEKFTLPQGVTAPDLAVIMTDGGRLQIRSCPQEEAKAPGLGQSPPSVPAASEGAAEAAAVLGEATREETEEKKSRHWREGKIGLLLTRESKPKDNDPCPLIPQAFVDPKRIPKLAREIRKQTRQGEGAAEGPADPELEAEALEDNSQ